MKVVYHPSFCRLMERDRYATRIFWSPAMLDYLRRNYATTLNEDLAGWLGVSQRTVTRKARQLGLRKDSEWLRGIWEERRAMAHSVSRRKGYPGSIQKGEHRNTAGEFKRGMKRPLELEEKRIASMRKWYRTHPDEARAKSLKAWETRRGKEGVC